MNASPSPAPHPAGPRPALRRRPYPVINPAQIERNLSDGFAALIPARLRPFVRHLPLIIGALLFLALAWINANPIDRVYNDARVPTRVQIAMAFAGMACIVWGMAGSPGFWRRLRFKPREWLLMLALMIAALLFRFIQIEETLRVLPDESNFVASVLTTLKDDNLLLFYPMSDVGPFPWLFATLQADTTQLLGRNLAGIRGAAAIYGAAAVVAVYLWGRLLIDQRTGLFAAVLLLAMPPHLHFSRMTASMTIADAWIAVMHLAALAYALKAPSRASWGLAGVTLGFTQYYSDANKLLAIPFTVVALLWLFIADPASRAAIRRGLIPLVIATAIVALPVYTTLLAFDKPLFGRVGGNSTADFWNNLFNDGLSGDDLTTIAERLLIPIRFLLSEPEKEAVYYAGTEPLIIRVVAPLFVIGAAAALARWRWPAVLPLALVLTYALGNAIFIRDAASSPRYVGALPAIALLMAFAISAGWAALVRLRAPRWLPAAAAAVILTGATLAQATYYFGPHLDHFKLMHRRSVTFADPWDATLRVNATLPRATQGIYIGRPAAPGQESSLLLGYLQNGNLYPFLNYEAGMISTRTLRDLPRDRGYAFLVETRHDDVIALLYRTFPQAAAPRYAKEVIEPREQYALVYVPPAR